MDAHPDRWIQLTGNHEAQYLDGGEVFWPEPLAGDDVLQVREWWANRPDGRRRRGTHQRRRGLPDHPRRAHVGAWQELGVPDTAATAARWLNDRPPSLLWRGSQSAIDRTAGPFWAEAGWELYEPWLRFAAEGGFIPFGQIHGHSSIVRYADRQLALPGPGAGAGHRRLGGPPHPVPGRRALFIGVDPKHGRAGAAHWSPLVLKDAVVTSAHTRLIHVAPLKHQPTVTVNCTGSEGPRSGSAWQLSSPER